MERRLAELSNAVLRYLAAHPNAADSAVGIRQWWLGDVGFKASAMELQAALDQMVARRQIRVSVLADGIELYSSAAGV
ncbi:MAG: hypothetical protein JWQ90_2990 [Hydrocarboniphaga sp.]|nr:hypothetical protein [Hydrocarboniphaga sp.]